VARELLARRPRLKLTLLEAEPEVGTRQTGHNSGVVHAGIYYTPGSLKARLCVAGARLTREYCEREGLPFEACGKVIVARTVEEVPALDELERRARANGVAGLRRVDRAGLSEVEPECEGAAALHSPETAITDFGALARSLAAGLETVGATVARAAAVERVDRQGGRVELSHRRGETRARFAVFCTGGDTFARLDGAPRDMRIVPFLGRYHRLDPSRADLVRGLIYPVPDPSLPFLGVHLTRHVGGEVSLGPTALTRPGPGALAWPGTWRMARRWWRAGAHELANTASSRRLVHAAASYVPELRAGDFEYWFAGLRAQAVARDGTLVDDFVLHQSERALHVRNAPSPAATSAFALAREICDRVEQRL
jgi:L-2-hydroxyglutarate oxidase LhgO